MFKLACIGLDTSHAVKFTELIQGKESLVEGLRVVRCMRMPSPFQTEPDQDKRQQTMEGLGVAVSRSFEESVDGADGILLELNDPALHREYFEKAARRGVPVFLDKPMADTIESARAICRAAKEAGIPAWSSSSLRFTPEIQACHEALPDPILGNAFGALGKAAAGSSIVWYGVHAFEMLAVLMGRGARSVSAKADEQGVVSVVQYTDGRRGVVESNSKGWRYGGRVQHENRAEGFIVDASNSGGLYANLIRALAGFFLEGVIPVPLEETFEVQAMLNAAEASIASGSEEPVARLDG